MRVSRTDDVACFLNMEVAQAGAGMRGFVCISDERLWQQATRRDLGLWIRQAGCYLSR